MTVQESEPSTFEQNAYKHQLGATATPNQGSRKKNISLKKSPSRNMQKRKKSFPVHFPYLKNNLQQP